MKPDQLNRLIKVNSRIQPWFLRNTSELYESAVRTYYEHGYSLHNRQPHHRTENVGPLRRIKKAKPQPDIYPRSHILQTEQLLQSMMQANRPRSMSFSAARPYSVYGQSSARSAASSDCSSASSDRSSHTDILLGSLHNSRGARRERRRSERRSRQAVNEKEEQLMESEGMFSGRSMSMPPLPSGAAGLRSTVTMPPSRQHHMAAIAKSSLAQHLHVARDCDVESLMPVDAALKRRISVIAQLEQEAAEEGGRRGRARVSELGHRKGGGQATGNGSHITGNGRQPSEMRFRFQTLGDRIKQFEYIQFADGPVASYAFDRSQPRSAANATALVRRHNTPRHRIDNSTMVYGGHRRSELGQQPRQLGFHNVLHANYRQRSRSLEQPVQLMEHVILRPATPVGPFGSGATTRGSSVDSSSRTTFKPTTSAVTWPNKLEGNSETSAQESIQSLVPSFGNIKITEENSTDWDEAAAEDWSKSHSSSSSLVSNLKAADKPAVASSSKGKENCAGVSSGSSQRSKLSALMESTSGETSGSSPVNAANAEPHRSPLGVTSKHPGSSKAKAGSFSSSLSGQDEISRVPLAPVRRLQLQQRNLQTAPKVEDPTAKDLPLSPVPLKTKGAKDKPLKKKLLLEKPVKVAQANQDKPRVTKVTSNQVSRFSHQAFLHSPEKHKHEFPAASPPKKSHHDHQDQLVKRPEEKQQKREPPPARTSANLKGANQLLVASASQVSAYKRAFRTQQQILKAEILQKQAQHLQQARNATSQKTPKPQSQRCAIPDATNRSANRTIAGRSAATSEGKAHPLNAKQASKDAGKAGSELRTKVFTGSPGKTAANPSTAAASRPPAAKRTAQPGAAKTGGIAKTTKKEAAVSGVVPAVAAGTGRKSGGAGWKAGMATTTAATTTTTTRRTALTLAAQQQHSRNGNSLLGFQRETVNRAAAALLQRRDADEPLSQLPSTSASLSQSTQQRRQFHFSSPPWRPS
ncbi:AF4/FMR2 family member lilli [Drosophila ficusphila]|uniref:AF4/FMR2 family member lilli n=1 Tax=Drosophila ficusphila TaxID=30025 RepID=UPI0007E81B28|nr:AF4/FMR2 family member lilli [Drosophila ficusphila]